jgi:hypothetical protein
LAILGAFEGLSGADSSSVGGPSPPDSASARLAPFFVEEPPSSAGAGMPAIRRSRAPGDADADAAADAAAAPAAARPRAPAAGAAGSTPRISSAMRALSAGSRSTKPSKSSEEETV